MQLRKSLVYFLIFTLVGAFFTYRIVAKAYDNSYAYDIDTLPE